MTAVEYLSYLRSRDVVVTAAGDRLQISAPKEAVTAQMREEIAERKPEILRFLREVAETGPTERSIARAFREDRIPLSFAQERMWFIHKLASGGPLYNMKRAYRIHGPLQTDALQSALDGVVARHEILRTRITEAQGLPEQVVHPSRPVDLRTIDWSGRNRIAAERELMSFLRKQGRQSYDFAEDLMLRALLIRLADDDHVLFLGLHHIAADGWSLSILLRELSALYAASVSGVPAALNDLPIQYADYAVWQREETERRDAGIAFWRERLSGVPPLELPADHPQPRTPSMRGAYEAFAIPADVTAGLKELARSEHVTLYVVLLAAFSALLHRYSGQEDVLIGSPVANRKRRELEPLIGLFVTTTAIRTDLSGNPTFREVLRRVHRWTIESLSYPDVPFEQLDLWSRGDARNGSLLRTLFAFQNLPKSTFALEGLKVERMPSLTAGVAKFDLSLTMREKPPYLLGGLSYSTDLFERATVAQMASLFRTFAAAAAANPDRPVGALQLLQDHERTRIVADWNRTDVRVEEQCVHELFEAQARRTPNAAAVIDGAHQHVQSGPAAKFEWTYAELDERADRLADELRKRGVGPGDVVGICMDRSVDLIAGLLGILKAGGAYLPLDPEYPADRLRFMVEDAGPRLLLVQERHLARLPDAGVHVLAYDAGEANRTPDATASGAYDPYGDVGGPSAACRRAAGGDLAYVIYTSGSTGRPKGVMIEHRSLSNLTQYAGEAFELHASDRVLQFASVSFDTAAEEIYPTLTRGAALVLRDARSLGSIRAFVEYCARHRITVLDLPTAFWHELVQEMERERVALPATVRLVVIGGERARPEMLAAWLRCTRVRLLNTYGPTETTVSATLHELGDGAKGTAPTNPDAAGIQSRNEDEGHVLGSDPVPIGRPIWNTYAFVLDRHMNPVPPGLKGELYIGGAGVARGYLNRPDLTAERFVANPFGGHAARLYRTGDVARWRTDGVLEYLGRVDRQVKIRGFRVELGEIESALQQHASVADCAVMLCDQDAGREQLVAYVVARSGSEVPSEELRRLLAKQLPAYMMPSVFTFVRSLPKLPNGKVDRRALPSSLPDARSDIPSAAPRNETEALLAEIWSDVLGVRPIGLHDNFFELGGHSLLVMRVVARVRDALQYDLPVRSLFETPTLAGLAAAIDGTPRPATNDARPGITRVERKNHTVSRSTLIEKSP